MDGKYYAKRILKIAVPLLISNIIMQLQMVIDRIFLGRLGDYYMTAIGNVGTPAWTTMSVVFTLSIGASVLISQSVGAGDHERALKFSAALIKWHNVPSIFLFFFWLLAGQKVFALLGVSDTVMPLCMGYLRYFVPVFLITGISAAITVVMQTSNFTRPLIWYGIIRSGVNIILDWALIFGHLGLPAMGIEGAALATTIAEYLGGIFILVIYIKSKKLPTRPSWKKNLKASPKYYLKSIKLGIPASLEDFCFNLGSLVIIRILNSISDKAAGIYTMVFNVEIIAIVAIAAIGNATLTLTGEATGKKDGRMYGRIISLSYLMTLAVTVLLLITCFAIPETLLGLFTTDDTTVSSSVVLLYLMAFNMFSKAGNIIIGNGIRGSGDTRWMLMTQILGTILLTGVAACMVYGFKMGIIGVFIAVLTDEFVRCMVNLGKERRVVSTLSASE